jgi:hypothetical protein
MKHWVIIILLILMISTLFIYEQHYKIRTLNNHHKTFNIIHNRTIPMIKDVEISQSIGIYIETFYKDIHYLIWNLRSISKFLKFKPTIILVSYPDDENTTNVIEPLSSKTFGLDITWRKHSIRKDLHDNVDYFGGFVDGYKEQMYYKLIADLSIDADFIWHIDSDTILKRDIDINDLLINGAPVNYYRDWGKPNDDHSRIWRPITEYMFKEKSDYDFLCNSMPIYHRSTYVELRLKISERHNMTFEDYIIRNNNKFSEFGPLGHIDFHYTKRCNWVRSGNNDDQYYREWSRIPLSRKTIFNYEMHLNN